MPSHALEVLKSKVCNLDGLAKRIDAAHAAVQTAFQAVAQRAIEAGQLLIQAKSRVPHGEWEAWIAQNTAVSLRTARAYMQIARHWMEADEANRQRVADLSLRAMLTELAGPFVVSIRVAQSEEKPETTKVRVKLVETESEPKTITVPVYIAPALDQTEDPERAGGPEQDQLSATMKNIREAEERSATPHVIMGDATQSAANLDGINREWDKLDTADRDKFLSEKLRTHGHPDHRDTDIVDVTT